MVDVPAGASPSPINRTNSQINSLQARAQTLAEEITSDQNKVSTAAEQYDEQTVLLQQDRATLAKTEHLLQATRREVVAARVRGTVGGDRGICDRQRTRLASRRNPRLERE